MNRLRFASLMLVVIGLLSGSEDANAQFFGGGFYGGGMGGFAPPYTVGGYYPGYGMGGYGMGMMAPGYFGGYGYNPAFYGYGSPGNLSQGYMAPGYGMNGPPPGNPFAAYPGFGWWPMSATDVKATPVPVSGSQTPSNGNTAPGQGPQSQLSAAPSGSPVLHSGAEIKLVCPKAANGTLSYVLNGVSYTIQPGYSQTFRDDRTWKLEFRRGGDGSELVTYTLKPGMFRFASGDAGWELRQVVPAQTGELPPAPHPAPELTPGPTPSPTVAPTSGPRT